MKRLVFGHDEVIAKWAAEKLGGSNFLGEVRAIGFIDSEGSLVGATVLHNASKYDVEGSIVGRPSKDLLLATAEMAFARHERISIRVERGNKKVLRAAVKYGFRLEGTVRRLFGRYKRHDAVMFGMLKSEATRFVGGDEDASRMG